MSETTTVLAVDKGDDHVATVRLVDPRRGNPMGMAFWREVPSVFAALAADDAVRAVVLTTDGDHFTYGLDLPGVGPALLPALHEGLAGRLTIDRLGRELQGAFDLVAGCPKPVVASVHGHCLGAGVELIAACDVRVCAANANFGLREVRMGMVPDVGGIQRLPFLIGEGHARYLALTGADVNATTALAMGLVNEVHPDPAAARTAALRIARAIAANPPRVVAGIKDVMNARVRASVEAGLRQALQLNTSLMQSHDFEEALQAFLAKRAPVFTGR